MVCAPGLERLSSRGRATVTRAPRRQVRHRDTRLRFFENPNDLTLRELRFPHDRSFGREQSTFECLPRGEAYALPAPASPPSVFIPRPRQTAPRWPRSQRACSCRRRAGGVRTSRARRHNDRATDPPVAVGQEVGDRKHIAAGGSMCSSTRIFVILIMRRTLLPSRPSAPRSEAHLLW